MVVESDQEGAGVRGHDDLVATRHGVHVDGPPLHRGDALGGSRRVASRPQHDGAVVGAGHVARRRRRHGPDAARPFPDELGRRSARVLRGVPDPEVPRLAHDRHAAGRHLSGREGQLVGHPAMPRGSSSRARPGAGSPRPRRSGEAAYPCSASSAELGVALAGDGRAAGELARRGDVALVVGVVPLDEREDRDRGDDRRDARQGADGDPGALAPGRPLALDALAARGEEAPLELVEVGLVAALPDGEAGAAVERALLAPAARPTRSRRPRAAGAGAAARGRR